MIKLNIQRFSSTNKTTHYELSQYVSSDLPTYLVDYNSDMSKIDTGINTAQTTADTASTAATNAATAASSAQTTANTAVTNAATAQSGVDTNATAIGTLANLDTTVKSSLVAATNEVVGKIGNLTNLTTDSKTDIVSAINSIETKIEELDNYSTNEADTGMKWIDNKPIYRKVIQVNNSSASNEFTVDVPSNIDTMVNFNVVGFTSAVEQRPLPGTIINYQTGNVYTSVTYRNNNSSYRPNKIEIFNSDAYIKFDIVIEYTKTSA